MELKLKPRYPSTRRYRVVLNCHESKMLVKIGAPEPYGEAGAEVDDEVLLVPSCGGSEEDYWREA